MKKLFLFGFLALIAACQRPTPTSVGVSTPSATLPPPPAPATVTKSFSPTPEFTPTTVPLFFTEEFDTDLQAWVSFQTGGAADPKLTLKNGLLRLDIPSPSTWYYAIHSSHDYEDVFVTAKFVGTPAGSMGVICRYSSSGWYEFNIASDGTYQVLFAQWLADGIAQYTPIRSDDSEYLQPGNLSYEIGLTCQDDHLLLHVNGKLFRKLDVARYELSAGKVGISSSSFDEIPMIGTFDWVKVSEPDQ